MIVGFFVYGYTVFIDWFGEIPDLAYQAENPQLLRTTAFVAPLLAIAGGAMAKARALWGGILMLLAAGGMLYALGFGVFTMFPIAMTGLAALFAALGRATREPGTME